MENKLTKGQKVNLCELNPELRSVFVGAGWDVSDDSFESFDLDVSAFLLGANGLVRQSCDFIYYNNLTHPTGAVVHSGDNTTGDGEGDDEAVTVDFSLVPPDVEKIVFSVSIYEAMEREQTFGDVKNAYIRFYDEDLGELFRYDLGDTFKSETAVIFGELCKEESGWSFTALGEGLIGGVIALSRRFGVFRK